MSILAKPKALSRDLKLINLLSSTDVFESFIFHVILFPLKKLFVKKEIKSVIENPFEIFGKMSENFINIAEIRGKLTEIAMMMKRFLFIQCFSQ